MSNPYSSPLKSAFDNQPLTLIKPTVVNWYRVYVAFMALVYLACCIGSLLMVLYADELADHQREVWEFQLQGGIFFVIAFGLFVLFTVGLCLGYRKSTWIYGIVLIGIGMTSPCCMPITIPLLIFWIKEETKCWFNV